MSEDTRAKLVGLLDYVEQVLRLDERVAFRLSEYRLADGTSFILHQRDTRNLPGVRHDQWDEDGPIWLEIDRLARREPPKPLPEIVDWIVLSSDPARRPEPKAERIVTVSSVERDVALSKGEVRPDDVMETPHRRTDPPNTPPRFDLTFRLEDRPEIAQAIEAWVLGPWAVWAREELPRRRTIALYQQLYKTLQMLEAGGAESPVEVIWGIGLVHWKKDGALLERPLLEARVDLELDDAKGGRLRVRPTTAEIGFDLKPYEEFGCPGLAGLSDLIRREVRRAQEDVGVSPFTRESFEPILSAAASRLDPEGTYVALPEASDPPAGAPRLTVTDQWVLFARPRSQHVVLQDIERLREKARDEDRSVEGLPERLVTTPSRAVGGEDVWKPLEPKIGSGGNGGDPGPRSVEEDNFDIFFPKPFNDDQIEIVRRLRGVDGLVVQGPPGTGKTHTIANLICHSMATGQRVLVVSKGEAALAVLKDQLPVEVQPLAISVLSSERQGLRQIEDTIREIQSVVEGTRPESRLSHIRRMESEIVGLRDRVRAIDAELDEIAGRHLAKMGPRGETPSELARRIVAERKTFAWFGDRPLRFASETGLADAEMTELAQARHRTGDLIDHVDAELPSPADLPAPDTLRASHQDLVRARELGQTAQAGPIRSLQISEENIGLALELAQALEVLADAHPSLLDAPWMEEHWRAALCGQETAWLRILRQHLRDWEALDRQRAELLRRPVELPEQLLDSGEAREAIVRAAAGDRLWPRLSFGKSEAKALVAAIRIDGATLHESDLDGWRHVATFVVHATRRRETVVRWVAFATEMGAPAPDDLGAASRARKILGGADGLSARRGLLSALSTGTVSAERLAADPELCRRIAVQLRAAAGSAKLAAIRGRIDETAERFGTGKDRTSVLAAQLLKGLIGRPEVQPEKLASMWRGLLDRLETIKARAADFETIQRISQRVVDAGAPQWAEALRTQPAGPQANPPAAWRDAWDHAAAEANLTRIDARDRLAALVGDREAAEQRSRKLFADLVRERTFYELNRRLSAAIKSALVEFVRALARIGKGTGKSAGQHRRVARDAMSRCYDAVPCWIMPTWRVAEQLPAEMGAVDLVIIDEASQSDVTELPALLRGKKILVVGDDRQVSPTAPFVTQMKLAQLRHHYLSDLPFNSLLEPGESIYDLMRAVFPNERLMLKEHFRCVEPIIRFSMQFYPEKMLPLRIPVAHERFDPPLVDIYVPHGARDERRKINRPEADVIVDEIRSVTAQSSLEHRTIGVISLIGSEQADYIRSRLSETIGEALMQRHSILCGDSATFQGSERDIVYLSMVADPSHKTALTMLKYEQRFNVAASRARDRLVLVRSVKREDLQPADLKARLIAHFENPMADEEVTRAEGLAACESAFERDLMVRLLDLGYRVQPQVGALGFRIDMVAEGADGRRLAIECDGDRFHGPEQWREDMRRQRVLERVGWKFWRCFASSFYRDPDGVTVDLVETLRRLGIEPLAVTGDARPAHRFTEHRTAADPVATPAKGEPVGSVKGRLAPEAVPARRPGGIAVGDRVILIFADGQRRMSARLTQDENHPEKGQLGSTSPLGKAILGAEEGDEVEFRLEDGRDGKVLIEAVTRLGHPTSAVHNEEPKAAVA